MTRHSTAPAVAFGVLGPVEASTDRGPLGLKGHRQRAVMARLLVARGRVVPLDRLVGDLWEQPPDGAVAAIRTFVSDLRRALEPGRSPRQPARLLVTTPPGYALRPAPDAVDAWRFETLTGDAGRLLAAGDPVPALPRLDEALALWRGPAYAEYAAEGWARGEINRLDELRMLTVERRAEALLATGRANEAVSDLRGHADNHPLREDAWRLLATALYAAGRQGDALAALRRVRESLAAELGVDPGPRLRQLQSDILTQAPHLTPPTAAAPAPAAPAPAVSLSAASVPVVSVSIFPGGFVGRDDELARLEQAAEQVTRHGQPTLALVSGDAGAGKTALAEALTRRLSRRGWITAWGRVPEYEGAPVAWPWVQITEALAMQPPVRSPPAPATPVEPPPAGPVEPSPAGRVEPSPAGRAERVEPPSAERVEPPSAERVEPPSAVPVELSPVERAEPAPVEDSVLARFRLRRATIAQLSAVAAQGPLLLVLDDLHRADDGTLDLLAALVGEPEPVTGPVFVIGSYRATEISPELTTALARLARTEPVRIYLGGLSETATGELAGTVAGQALDPATAHLVHRRSGGNPFFVRELARLLAAEGPQALRDVPVGVRDVIRHRLARLPEPARNLLRQAAVIGRDVDPDVLAALAGDGAPQLDALDDALHSGFLTEQEPEGRLRFTHILVRDTIYRDLSALRRARWHATVAEALERLHPYDIGALAHHFDRAASRDTAPRAAHYGRLAAEQAERRFDPHEAARLWRQTVHAHDRADGTDVRDRLHAVLGLGRTLAVTGHLAEARRHRSEAIEAAEQLDDPNLVVAVLAAFDVPAIWTSNDDADLSQQIVRAAERALATLTGNESPADHRPQTSDESPADHRPPTSDESPADHRPPAPDESAADHRPALRSRLLSSIALELRGTTTDRGRAAATEAEAIARDVGDPRLLAFALNARFMHSFHRPGLATERAAIGTELVALAARHELVTFEVLGHLVLLQAHSALADFRTADAHAQAVDGLAERYELPLVGVFTHWYAGLRLAVDGHPAEAEAAYRAANVRLTGTGMSGMERGLLPLALLSLRLPPPAASTGAGPDPGEWEGWDFGPYEPWVRPLALVAAGRRDEATAALAALPESPHDLLYEVRLCLAARVALALGDQATMERVHRQLLPAAEELAGAGTAALTLGPVADHLRALGHMIRSGSDRESGSGG
ncbi:BTAD domain-containing putative transcriptional regulator [Micromonospora sp. NPDC050397]|uniref:BTAD domain-containing putative transcriptional regulator n=1 Tax=Micromonospora sp. NPDC050397 TaxID=3364279 RepID=UPI00384AED3E